MRRLSIWDAGPAALAAAGFGVLLAVLIYLADSRRLGFLYGVYDFPYGDKVGHFVLFGTLALLACLALSRGRPPIRSVLGTAIAVAVVVTLEELSQAWMPARRLDAYDLAASYAGVATGAVCAAIFRMVERPVFTRR